MKARRSLSLFLVVAMILTMFTMILPASAAPGETRTGIHTRSRTVYTYYSDEQLMDMFHVDLETLQRMSYDARYAYLHNERWDVRPYAIQRDSVEADALFQVLYRQPECFAVIRFSYSYDSDDNLTYVKPLYTNGYEVAMEQHSALMDAVQEIMCLFQRAELTDLELAILVHDYLAANFEYHYPTLSLPQEEGKYSAYNLLVEGTAVCQGYAEAFALIMMQFGIHCGLCQSDTLHHAWSILELDGKEYHVDVTWDDPSYDMYGKVSHEFFLISTDAMNSHEKHAADDFTATPNNKEFDTAFWQDIESSFCLLNNTIYYIGTTGKTSGALYTWKDGVSTRLYDLNYTWKASANSYWPGCHSRLITDGEKLFYSTPNEIFAYDPATGESTSVYTYVNDENPYCYIYGFNIKDNNLYINVHNTPVYTTLEAKAENTVIHPYRAEAVETHVFGDPVFTTFPCETDGEARYDCIYCGFSKIETIPPQGHDYRYTDLQDGTHTEYCSRCTLKINKPHSFENGICCCGAIEIAEDASLKINHTLNLASDISVNFAVNKSLLANYDMNTVYMECSVDTYEGNTKTGTTVIKLLPVDQGYYYYFTLEGLTAVQMNDAIVSVLYGSKDGKQYRSATDIYSVADYAYSQLNKDTVAESLKILCADLLRYGSAAQSFKNYRTDAPVDGAMTDTHRAFLSSLESITFGNTNVVLEDLSTPVITWVGKALELNSKVSLKFVINASAYTGDISALRLKISYTDYAGQKQTLYLEGAEPYANPGCYAFTFDSLLAAELRSVVAVQVCEGTTPLSCTLQYSADTYGNGKTGTLLTLCKALFAYSDSAKAYFAS